MEAAINSASTGDPRRHLTLDDLERGLSALPPAPRDRGAVILICRRGEGGLRETPAEVELSPGRGVEGDAWERRLPLDPQAQIAVMEADVAALIAGGQPLVLAGDNLFVSLDLSTGNLPAGSRLRAGTALLEVTPKPHNGCRKFRTRFGDGALRLVSDAKLRHRNLRGIYLCVIEPGILRVGDSIEVAARS